MVIAKKRCIFVASMKKLEVMTTLMLCFLFWACSAISDDDEVMERVKVGDRVPAFTVDVVVDGEMKTFSTSQLTGETVIIFFHTSCADCRRELPRLNDYYLQHRDEPGFQMVAISRAEGAETIASFWMEQGLQMPYSAQEDRHIYDLFASSVIPRVYFVSAQGIVTRVLVENLGI